MSPVSVPVPYTSPVSLLPTIAGIFPLCLCHLVWHHCWHMPHLSVPPSLTPLLAYVICVCLYPTHVSCVHASQQCWLISPVSVPSCLDTISDTCPLCLCYTLWHHCWHISPVSVPSCLTSFLTHVPCVCATQSDIIGIFPVSEPSCLIPCLTHVPMSVSDKMTPLLTHVPWANCGCKIIKALLL